MSEDESERRPPHCSQVGLTNEILLEERYEESLRAMGVGLKPDGFFV
jgi:hypothetical protein